MDIETKEEKELGPKVIISLDHRALLALIGGDSEQETGVSKRPLNRFPKV